MDFEVVTAKIDEIGYSPIIRSNCWAVLALAAQATRTMRIGAGVNVPGLRLAAPDPRLRRRVRSESAGAGR